MSIKSILSACLLASSCAAPLAYADIITFDNADLTRVAFRPSIFTTQDFVFTSFDYAFIGGGTAPYSNGTNTLKFALFDLAAKADTNAVTFRRQDAALFNLNSLEFSPGDNAGDDVKLGIKGVYADGSTVSGFVEAHNGGGLTPIGFQGWTNLSSVILSGNWANPGYVQVDNINVSAVPEPATYAMLFGGLGLLGVVGRRAKRA